MTLSDLFGFAAATLTTASFAPQLVRIWRLKHAEGISVVTFSMFAVGILFWLVYGILQRAWPIIIANVLTLGLAIGIVVLTMRFRDRRP